MPDTIKTSPEEAAFVGSGVGRHETFAPRYGWLKKGYDAAAADDTVFTAPDAIQRLGVGKNMVRSIRFWCLAFRVLQASDGESATSRSALRSTAFGQSLLGPRGWDPYLEDPASLWLLHWQLFVPPYQAASWPLAFNRCTAMSFTTRQLAESLESAACEFESLRRLSTSGFQKDASCITRMYGATESRRNPDIVSPFAELGLIRSAGDGKSFTFNLGLKRTLPPAVVLASALSYVHHWHGSAHSVSLSQLAYGWNAPGSVFKLSETEVGRCLAEAVKPIRGVYLSESLGNRLLQFDASPETVGRRVLEDYYKRAGV